MARSVRNENTSSTTESAAAAVGLSLSIFEKICTDATCVLNGMFPEMRMTAPNSPTAREDASATPEDIDDEGQRDEEERGDDRHSRVRNVDPDRASWHVEGEKREARDYRRQREGEVD